MTGQSESDLEGSDVSQRLVAATIEAALDSVVIIDATGGILEFNPAAERTFGYARADVLGRQMSDLIVPPRLREAHRAGMARYLATGEARVLGRRIEITALRADGTEFPVELAILRVPVRGAPVFTAYIRDLSRQVRLQDSQRLLLDASALLASSLDHEETLHNLSHLIVPQFADWFAADVLDADGKLRRVAMAHRDPAKVALAKELADRYPDDAEDPHGITSVMRDGTSQLTTDITGDLLTKRAVDDTHRRLLSALGFRSSMVVPLRTHEGVIGALTLVTAESNRRYDEQDLLIGEELARQVAHAVTNSRLFAAVEEQRGTLEQQTTELATQAEELENTTRKLETTVAELRRSNEGLQQEMQASEKARQEAAEANEAKSVFLASMSHELRTPLNAIIGYAELLELGVRGPLQPRQLEDLRRIARSAQHLLSLINDILNFAKLQAGRVELAISATAVGPVLARVEEMTAPQAAAKHLSYVVRNDCGEARACADSDKLVQIMNNLVSNAIRYTDAGGRIDIHCWATATHVIIEASDTGIGIAHEKLEAVFEPFVQVSRDYTSPRQGTGLGLAISRDLARAMGGELIATSRVGRGSTFRLTLNRDTATAK